MQRRAAAVYVALFLVIAVGAYAFAAAAESPEIAIEDPEYALSEGDEFEIEGETYTVTEIGLEESEGDGHGGGGGPAEMTATIEWNITTEEEEPWENGDEVEVSGTEYEVVVPDQEEPDQFTLREVPGDDLTVVEDEDENRYVVIEDDQGEQQLVPIEEYDGLERTTLSEGDTVQYNDQEATVTTISADGVLVEWTEEDTDDVTAREGLEIDQFSEEQTYVAHLTHDGELQLTSDVESYQAQADDIEYFEQRTDGLTIVTILSGVTAGFLIMLAYLPRRE